jgi:hypothetical protein
MKMGMTNDNWQTTHNTQMTNDHMTNNRDGDGNPNTTNEQDNDTLPSLQM